MALRRAILSDWMRQKGASTKPRPERQEERPPSLEAFAAMTSSPDYQAIHVHREAGLAHQLLINCVGAEQRGAASR